ncbi:MAG: hypothetical protein ACFFDN_45875 [Candidatus Hodarchaeota archaeon]
MPYGIIMEDEKEEPSSDEKPDEKEKIRKYINEMTQSKKQPIAKDLVQLKHVEVQKQEVSQETMDLAKSLRDKYLEYDQFERLSNDELTILETFEGKRLFLSRIAIIANQSRVLLGIAPFKKAELEKILNNLIMKGYIEAEEVGANIVYFLTERGKYRTQ